MRLRIECSSGVSGSRPLALLLPPITPPLPPLLLLPMTPLPLPITPLLLLLPSLLPPPLPLKPVTLRSATADDANGNRAAAPRPSSRAAAAAVAPPLQ
jgi:hypothetical protein